MSKMSKMKKLGLSFQLKREEKVNHFLSQPRLMPPKIFWPSSNSKSSQSRKDRKNQSSSQRNNSSSNSSRSSNNNNNSSNHSNNYRS